MVFPQTALEILVEIYYDAAWHDITDDVQQRDGTERIRIQRGKRALDKTTPPATCSFFLNNGVSKVNTAITGRYVTWNPLSDLYGKIGLNTKVRVTTDGAYQRFEGEISDWEAARSQYHDHYVMVTAADILRRINQGSAPVTSGYKAYLMATSPVTYWPMDDGSESDRAWPVAGTYMGSSIHREFGYAVFTFAAGDLGSHLPPTLRINDTVPAAGSDLMLGYCKGDTSAPQNAIAIDFLYKLDQEILSNAQMSNWQVSLLVQRFGAVASTDDWRINFRPDGTNDDIELQVAEGGWYYDPGTSLANSAALDALTDGEMHHVRLQLSNSAGSTAYQVWVDGTSVISGTSGVTYASSVPHQMRISYNRLDNTEDLMAIGHVAVWEGAANIPDITTTSALAHGFAGETAGRRIERLCEELDIPFLGTGDLDLSTAMGVQFEDYFENQITECEATDQGMLGSPRSSFALRYRTGESLFNVDPLLTLDYSNGELVEPFAPMDDDAATENDVFAQRREGASFRATQDTGPKNVQAPEDDPQGVGRYKAEYPVNVETDEMLPAIAFFRLALGTLDEPRFPKIRVNRANPTVAADAALVAEIMAAEVGYPLVVTDATNMRIYDDITQLVVGYTESFNAKQYDIEFDCTSYHPYQVIEVDDADARVDPGELTTLNEALDTTETGVDITSTGFLWTTAGGDMPISIMVGGEEMTVSAISGASNPQTMTVTRSVNGVVKTHAIGANVYLKRPGRVAY